jgi:hypothetical protein
MTGMKIIRSLVLLFAVLTPTIVLASDSATPCSCCENCPPNCPCCD